MGEHKKMKQPVNWKAAADRVTIGEKVELVSLPGFWVRPRKFSVTGAAEIQAASVRALAQVRRDALREVAGAFYFDATGKADDALAGPSTEDKKEIALKVIESMTGEMVGSLEARKTKLVYGLVDHNFLGEPSAPTLAWAAEVMDHVDIFEEILGIIEEKNRPLALKTSGRSETSQSGDSTEPPSTTEPGSSLTEQTP